MFMQWFYNLGLAKKLTATFLIVMSFTAFLGIFSVFRLAKVNGVLTEMVHKWVASTEVLGHLSNNIATFRTIEMQHVLSGTREAKAGYEKEMNAVLDTISKNMAVYEPLVSLPEEKEFYEGFKRAWAGYVEVHNRILELSRQDKSSEAAVLCNGSSKLVFDRAADLIDRDIKFTSGKAQTVGLQGAGHYSSSRNLIIGIMLLSFVLGLLLTDFIVRRVTCRSLWWALQSLEKVAAGDLTQNIRVKSTEEIGQLFSAIKKIIDKLREFSNHINELTRALGDSSQEFLSATETMTYSAHEQAGQTEQVSSAVIEMSQTFMDVAGNAEEASRSSRETSEAARKGFATVAEVMNEMRKIVNSVQESSVTIGKLGQSSRKIGDIIATIEEVADQTNLLALNAAIEAARAGEHGRGFAVVADEVRALAERTGKATKEISTMIKSIQQDTAQAVTCMMTSKKEVDSGLTKAEEASQALEQIVDVSDKSMDMIQHIATATEQQSAVTEQVSSNVELIANGTRSSESAAGQIQESAKLLAKLSAELEETAKWFKVA